jgi:hypothetical protein
LLRLLLCTASSGFAGRLRPTLGSLLGLLCLLVLQCLYLGLQHLDLGLQQLRLLLLGFGISVAVGNFFEFVGGILDLPFAAAGYEMPR